jgi:hypothetical protein
MTANLLNELMLDTVDQSELELLLQNHFGMARGESPEEIHYFRTNEQEALILDYADGELNAIRPGPGLKENDILELKSKVHHSSWQNTQLDSDKSWYLQASPTKVGSVIAMLFSLYQSLQTHLGLRSLLEITLSFYSTRSQVVLTCRLPCIVERV